MNWKAFLEGVAAAAIGGAATGATAALQDGQLTAKQIGASVAVGAIVGISGYFKTNALKKKPQPQQSQSEPPPDPGPQG